MTTFHGDVQLKRKLLARIRAHQAADSIAQGAYASISGGKYRYCAVGCSLRDLGDAHPTANNWHDEMEQVLGIPTWLAALEDWVFENLPQESMKTWPLRFAQAIPVGVELGQEFADRLAVARLKETLKLAPIWRDSVRDQVVTAINGVIAAISPRSESAAESAAESAESARSAAATEQEANRIISALKATKKVKVA